MQNTRRHILDILRRRTQATVDEIVDELRARRGGITAVTVRHHLAKLAEDKLVATGELRRRATPGRPQYVYMLTDKAREQFPNNYPNLITGLLSSLEQHMPPDGVNVILDTVALDWARSANVAHLPLAERMQAVLDYLNAHGYEAYYEPAEEGVRLHTLNCPYHAVASSTRHLCEMDMRLIAALLGVTPRRIAHMVDGAETCSYLIPITEPLTS
jgi:predicted ArsR family transcriptional regulator